MKKNILFLVGMNSSKNKPVVWCSKCSFL